MKPAADEAVAQAPSVRHVIVLERLGASVAMKPDRDLTWTDLRVEGEKAEPGGVEPEDTGAEDVLMIAYTSGTTGRPKGAVHVHGGFLVKMASETAYQTDLQPDETLYWVTDMGWIMGPWEMVGAGARGATVVLYEGAPDWPEPDRVWASVERHRVNVLGVSPTLIRALQIHGDELRIDRGALEPRALPLALRRGRGGQAADHQHLRRHGSRRLLPDALPGRGDKGVLARRGVARDGCGRVRRSGEPGPGGRGRARVQARLARYDARNLGRRRTLFRDLLVDVPGSLAPRRLGAHRRRG